MVLKCVISGEPVNQLGNKKNVDPNNNAYNPDIDGVSTHIGVVHYSMFPDYQKVGTQDFDLSPVDATRSKIASTMGVNVVSKQRKNFSF